MPKTYNFGEVFLRFLLTGRRIEVTDRSLSLIVRGTVLRVEHDTNGFGSLLLGNPESTPESGLAGYGTWSKAPRRSRVVIPASTVITAENNDGLELRFDIDNASHVIRGAEPIKASITY